MKLIHTLTALSTLAVINLTVLARADSKKCDQSSCNKGKCETKGDCNSCNKDAAANTVMLVVTGMTCDSCSAKLTKALESVEGITTIKVCHESGCVEFSFDPAKTNKSNIISAINVTGFKVAGEKVSIPVTGMTCGSCSKKVMTALEGIEGCTDAKVCHNSGHVEFTIDTAKTSKEKVIETINATGFKAQTPKLATTDK